MARSTLQTFLQTFRARLRPRTRPSRRELLPAAWVGALVALEVTGRLSQSDVGDAPAVLLLVALAAFTWREHSLSPLPFVERLLVPLRRLWGRLQGLGFHAGSDLRRTPPLPRRAPPVVAGSTAVAVASATALFLAREHFPTHARETMTSLSAAVYLLVLGVLWGALLFGALSVFAPPLMFQSWIERRGIAGARRRTILWSPLIAGYLLLLATLSATLPRWTPLAVSGAALVAAALVQALPGGLRMDMLWRPLGAEGARREPAAVRLSVLEAWQALLLWCSIAILTLLSGGDRLSGIGSAPDDGSSALTTLLSSLFAWPAAMLFTGRMAAEVWGALRLRARNPERPAPPVVRAVAGHSGLGDRVREALVPAGFTVRLGSAGRSAPTDVPIVLGDAPERDPFALSERWPAAVSLEELETPGLRARLRRRHEVLCRRHLLRGLRRAFRDVPRRERARSLGTWVDPHQAASPSLMLELDDGRGRLQVGPPYDRAVPLASRRHLAEVMRALELDLVFVERGVSFRQLRRVYVVLFEVLDVHGGRQRAEERHFQGLAGLRVAIDEIGPQVQRTQLTDYPEPDYEDLGRARILHVFRDRGGDREPVSPKSSPRPELVPA